MGDSYRFAIDRGGTFTDVVAQLPDHILGGKLVTAKLLSSNPAHYDDAASEAVRRILAEYGTAPIAELRIGTTIATNALLERSGEPCALAITQGHRDALTIGNQARPDIFARHIVKPERLESAVIEIAERVGADGEVLVPLDEDAARDSLAAVLGQGCRAIAIVLMHGWKYTAHEARLAAMARAMGFAQVSVSHEVAPLIKLVPRGDTSVADAYLSPIIRAYIDQLTSLVPEAACLRFMQSNGGLAEAHSFRGKDAVLSGPAGGVVGMVQTAAQLGFSKVIGFDMGGTSTDVAHYAGEYERTGESVVAGIRIAAPMMHIHTVAAGGGSICRFDGSRLQVGPQSAGADPGPACYRKDGPLTLTDCNLALGRIDPDEFPKVFGPDGNQPLDPVASRRRLEQVAALLPDPMGIEELAEGFLAIGVNAMAKAISQVSTARGIDPSGHALACCGGAGGQFACRVADELGMETVLVHPLAGMLSAFGIGLAPLVAMREASLVQPLAQPCSKALATLADAASAALIEQGIAPGNITITARMKLRFAGSDTTLTVPFATPDEAALAFRREHRRRFGWSDEAAAIVLDALSVEASGTSGGLAANRIAQACRVPLAPGQKLHGPATIAGPGSTTIVEPGWQARCEHDGALILTRSRPRKVRHAAGTRADPVRLEIFNNLFMAIAQEMGVVLEATASSVNIKERLDFSCAIFDETGALIANAPHIPVHLGSMGESVLHIIARRTHAADGRGIRRGDAYVLNDPYRGGTHLPDVTVIVPVFLEDGDTPRAFVAARGHHADIGGIAPGSMPPHSTDISEEGIRIDNALLVDEGRFCEAELRALLIAGDYPARRPDRNLADLRAQLAACARGSQLLGEAASEHGTAVLTAFMGHVLDNGEAAVRRLLDKLQPGSFTYAMDNGAQVCVTLMIDREQRRALFDFTGTSDQLPGNFNAPRAITRAAVLYALRCLIDDPIPLNDGCLRPVTIHIPAGSMLSPRPPAAVVAGNVETSQVITEAILAATGRLAPAQGTMNNFTFGDAMQQYYETIAGGSGAGPDHPGTDAVQTHMTNSRLTDPEVLETRLPVRVERFAIREGSGGVGAQNGGNGIEREITFLEPMRAQFLANRHLVPPRGIAGGGDAQGGETMIRRADGSEEMLGTIAAADLAKGDTIVIRTPGGGAFGAAD